MIYLSLKIFILHYKNSRSLQTTLPGQWLFIGHQSQVDDFAADQSQVGDITADQSQVDNITADQSQVDDITADQLQVDDFATDQSQLWTISQPISQSCGRFRS